MKRTAPVLPARSMDFNAMHDSLAKGESDDVAIAKACGDKLPEKSKPVSSDKADKKG